MSLARVKSWVASETLTASDLNAEFNNILNYLNGSGVTLTSPTITGTVAGSATYTTPTLTSPVINTPTINGTATNDSAAAGVVGQLLKSTVASGAAVSLTTTVAANVTSISLTAGDWDVSGVVHLTGGASTTIGGATSGIGATTATLPTFSVGDTDRFDAPALGAGTPFNGGAIDLPLTPTRVSLSGTTTYYLVVSATFGVSTCSAFGTIRARRVR